MRKQSGYQSKSSRKIGYLKLLNERYDESVLLELLVKKLKWAGKLSIARNLLDCYDEGNYSSMIMELEELEGNKADGKDKRNSKEKNV